MVVLIVSCVCWDRRRDGEETTKRNIYLLQIYIIAFVFLPVTTYLASSKSTVLATKLDPQSLLLYNMCRACHIVTHQCCKRNSEVSA